MPCFLEPGTDFEIRCWREENAAIELASNYETISSDGCTDYEGSIKKSSSTTKFFAVSFK